MTLVLDHGTLYAQNQERPLLENLNFSFEKGKVYFVYGTQPQEKTMLAAAMAGLVQFDKGGLKFAGQLLTSKQLTYYRKQQVGLILREYNFLPFESPLTNLLYYCRLTDKKVTPADCLARLKKVGIEKETSKLPLEKLDLITQKKYELAKAVGRNPEVFVADGLLEDLDSYTERLFLNFLDYLAKELTICVVVMVSQQHLNHFPDVVLGLNRGKLNFIKAKETILKG
ncbi:ATP-binding cassette domain-containing protein [Enterococcus sp. LJL90]